MRQTEKAHRKGEARRESSTESLAARKESICVLHPSSCWILPQTVTERDNHDFSMEETAAYWQESIPLPLCGLLPGTDIRVYPEMVR